MAFDGSEGSAISLETASGYTANYREANPGATKGHFFGKSIINDILGQSGCKGIRIYYGQTTKGRKELIMAGADSSENDQIESGHTIADLSSPCPPYCGDNNVLNS